MERRINLDNQDIANPKPWTLYKPIQGLTGKIPAETLTLVERIKELELLVGQLITDLKKQQTEFVNLKTFIGFNE